jgi:hypothetical protein
MSLAHDMLSFSYDPHESSSFYQKEGYGSVLRWKKESWTYSQPMLAQRDFLR